MVLNVSWLSAVRRLRNTPPGYLAAAGALLLAVGLRWAVDPYVTVPFITLFPAIIAAALIGGRTAGIAVAVIGGVCSWLLWLEPRYSLVKGNGASSYFNAVAYVITSAILLVLVRYLNKALDELEQERDRANHLFSELQHRTANVMQNVSALLRTGMARVKHDPIATDILKTAQSRFDAMANIHRRLYEPQSAGMSNQVLLQDLCTEYLQALGSTAEVQVIADEKPLDHRKMFSLCVLLTELIMNSSKHAFPLIPGGVIYIWLTEREGIFKLDYADNGPGLPKGFSFEGPSLGGRIMEGLAAQLGGKLIPLTGGPGARFELQFPA